MGTSKVSELAFEDYSKATIQERLKALFKGRTLRQAALDWQLPYSTLNNYFSKGATPGLDVVNRIAHIEKIPVTWIINGKTQVLFLDECHRSNNELEGQYTDLTKDFFQDSPLFGFSAVPIEEFSLNNPDNSLSVSVPQDPQSITWNTIFQALSPKERNDLIGIFVKIGANSVIQHFTRNADLTAKWSNLSDEDQERLLRLNDQLKKGSLESGSGVAEPAPDANSKKVG